MHGALVVERTRREVGRAASTPPAPAPGAGAGRSRSSTPTGAASASSSPGLALMRSRIGAARPDVEQLHPAAEALLDAAPQPLRLLRARHATRRRAPRARTRRRRADPRDTSPSGAPDRRDPPSAPSGAVAEEHQVGAAHDRERHVVGCRRGRAASRRLRRAGGGELRVDQAEARDVDQPGMHAGGVARALEALDHVAPRHRRRRTRGRRRRRRRRRTHATCASSIRNGAAFRTCQRINWSRSCALAGTFSNRIERDLRGPCRARPAPRDARATPTFCSAVLIVATSAAWSWTFGAFSAGVTTPAGSGSTA